MDTLRNGDTGQQVTVLQKLLNQLGSSLTEDGDFGSKTEAAVKSYQKGQGLTQDGICGPKTWAAILAV
ncbi:MAG: peptidoglycan-binding protein [Clostridiales bacterium]|nr:peptidoglycan-binding protein [Clostridiales bacterium]